MQDAGVGAEVRHHVGDLAGEIVGNVEKAEVGIRRTLAGLLQALGSGIAPVRRRRVSTCKGCTHVLRNAEGRRIGESAASWPSRGPFPTMSGQRPGCWLPHAELV